MLKDDKVDYMTLALLPKEGEVTKTHQLKLKEEGEVNKSKRGRFT